MRKKFLILLLPLTILVLAFFWSSITTQIVGFALQKYAGEFKAEKIYLEDGQYVIENLNLEKEGVTIAAKKAFVDLTFHPLRWKVDLKVIVEKPLINLEKCSTFEFCAINSPSIIPFLRVNANLTIGDGKLVWLEKKGKNYQRKKAALSVFINVEDQIRSGHIGIALNTKDRKVNIFSLNFASGEEKSCKAEAIFNDVDLSIVCRAFSALGYHLQGWVVEDGKIDGRINVLTKEDGNTYSWGDVNLKSLVFSNPEKNMIGKVEEAKIDLERDFSQVSFNNLFGKVEILKKASLVINQKDKPIWEIQNLLGFFELNKDSGLKVDFSGNCNHKNHDFTLSVNGGYHYFDKDQGILDLLFSLHSDAKEDATFRLIARKLGTLNHLADIEIKNISKEEMAFVQTAAGRYFPELNSVEIQGGNLNASGSLYFQSMMLTDLKIDKICAENVLIAVETLNTVIDVGKATGNFCINFQAPNILESIDANLSIDKGHLDFSDSNSKNWRLQGLNTNINVTKGVLQKSIMTGEFASLKGTIIIDWRSLDNILSLNFTGKAQEIIPFVSESIGNGIKKSLVQESVNLTGNLRLKDSLAKFAGKILIYQDNPAKGQAIDIAFDLKKSSEKFWRSLPPEDVTVAFFKNAGFDFWQKVMPSIALPAIYCQSNWIKTEAGMGGVILRNGSFQVENIPLEKTLNHVLFPEDDMLLSGVGSFRGFFDNSLIALEYEGRDVCLENNFLKMEVDTIKNDPKSKLTATYYYDIDKGNYFSCLPLVNARYTEKKSGHIFKDINALAILEGDKVHLPELTLSCRGLYFAGSLDVDFDFPEKETFGVDIRTHTIRGKVAEVKDFLKGFDNDFSFLEMPLDGDVSYLDKGGKFIFSFKPQGYTLQTEIDGRIERGTAFSNHAVSVQDIDFKFTYDHEKSFLEISDFNGIISSNVKDTKPLRVYAETLRFDDLNNRKGNFDIWFGDHSRDLIRLVGKTELAKTKSKTHFIEVDLNHELTHFGDIHPQNFKLLLRDWRCLEHLHLSFETNLPTLIKDLRNIYSFGLISTPKNLFNKIDFSKGMSGDLEIDLNYDAALDAFNFKCFGKDLSYLEFMTKIFILKGSQKGDQLFLDQFKMDNIEALGEITRLQNDWLLDRFSLQYGKSLFLDLKGRWLSEKKILQSEVNDLKFELSDIKKLSGAFITSDDWRIDGNLQGSGTVQIAFNENVLNPHIDAVLDSSLTNWSLKGLYLQDAKNVSCHYNSDHGFTLRNLKTALHDPCDSDKEAVIDIGKVDYEFQNGDFVLEDFKFQLASSNLAWFAGTLKNSFPDFFSTDVCQVIAKCKKQGEVKGRLTFELNPPYAAAKLALEDGLYNFYDMEHDFKDFVLEYDPYEFKICTKYKLANNDVWLLCRSTSPTLDFGEAWLADEKDNFQKNGKSLYINWKNEAESGFDILEMKGVLSGFEIDLQQEISKKYLSDKILLEGDVIIEPQAAFNNFPKNICDKIEDLAIGSKYKLGGKWSISQDKQTDFLSSLHFNGILSANEFLLKGYQFDKLISSLEFDSDRAMIRDLQVNDQSGTLKIDKMDCHKARDQDWRFLVPSLQVINFRPSLLKDAGKPRAVKAKPLIVKNLTLQNWEGVLSNCLTYTGSGNLYFTNKSKNILQNTIFQIPKDILSCIGLDPMVLTPVRGSISYYLKDGKINLFKFKDIYSEGKLSKFNLADANSSYVDYNGRLNVLVRMKQHNLLFKLAELFTVSVKGNLQKPVYSLQKHKSNRVAFKK